MRMIIALAVLALAQLAAADDLKYRITYTDATGGVQVLTTGFTSNQARRVYRAVSNNLATLDAKLKEASMLIVEEYKESKTRQNIAAAVFAIQSNAQAAAEASLE